MKSPLAASLGSLASALAFGGSIPAIAILVGTRDLESYEHAFFSLDRGTHVESVSVLGHPVYTLAIGLGARLPLHGSLGASPAAFLAPYLPAPVTYYVLLTVAVAAAALIVRHGLEPLCGRLITWLALVLLFYSAPVVNYSIYDDWPEAAVTYCALVACVFAPHALLSVIASSRVSRHRQVHAAFLAAVVWGLIGVSHPGIWPILAAALVLTSALVLCRVDYALSSRMTATGTIAVVSLIAVALQVPDILREVSVAGSAASGMRRFVQGPEGALISSNLFPYGDVGARRPFVFLLLALVSLAIGLTSKDSHNRTLMIGSALITMILGVGAAAIQPGGSPYAPSTTWVLRDPAAAFSILCGACAAASMTRWRVHYRPFQAGLAGLALALAALQGPAYAVALVAQETPDRTMPRAPAWTRDLTSAAERVSLRGLPRDLSPGVRLALWPGERDRMRAHGLAATDIADAGYLLVTAWTKQRTMVNLVRPNEVLFNQFIDLAPQLLCDADVVHFLQLRYLLMPAGVPCAPWGVRGDALVDGRLEVRVPTAWDDRVRGLPAARASEPLAREPALSARSALVSALSPLADTSVHVGPRKVSIQMDDPSVATGQVLLLPVAHDSAWRPSDGEIRNVGGLLALIGVTEPRVTVDFVPDGVAVLRATSMTVAQLLSFVGLLGLACVRPVATPDVAAAVRRAPVVIPKLPHPVMWLYLVYSGAVMYTLDATAQDADETGFATALMIPVAAFSASYLSRSRRWQYWVGGTLLAVALIRTAAAGSLSPRALRDPLYWLLMAIVALGVWVASRRRPAVAWSAAALTGACVMVATLLPMILDSGMFQHPVAAVRASMSGLSNQIGVGALVTLLALWLHAILFGSGRVGSGREMGAAARGALISALVLTLGWGLPLHDGLDAVWMIALGCVLGVAHAWHPPITE